MASLFWSDGRTLWCFFFNVSTLFLVVDFAFSHYPFFFFPNFDKIICTWRLAPAGIERSALYFFSAPEVSILDDKGRQVFERYYKAGSTIRLSCVAKQAESNPADSIVWSRGKLLSAGIT